MPAYSDNVSPTELDQVLDFLGSRTGSDYK
jgi:hypothetical protein